MMASTDGITTFKHLVLQDLRVFQSAVQALLGIGVAKRWIAIQEYVNDLHDI